LVKPTNSPQADSAEYVQAETDRPLAPVFVGRFEAPTPLPAGFRDINDLVGEIERVPGGTDRMERARKRLAERLAPTKADVTLAMLRLQRGWSQARLGGLVGATQAQIARYESGKQSPNAEHIAGLAAALGVTADELLASLGIKARLKSQP
jgi:DNA-binding XRE family transcriptional regulator